MTEVRLEDTALLEQCVAYFKANHGFVRLFKSMRDKYRSLGTIGGTVVIKHLKKHEKEALTGFLRKDYASKESATVRMQDFQKALEDTKFGGLTLEALLKAYFLDELVSNKQCKEDYQARRSLFFDEFIDLYKETPAAQWLFCIFRHMDNAYRTLLQRYDTDPMALKQDLLAVCEAVNNLPVHSEKRVRLPVFASSITKNPHAFDDNTSCGQLLLQALIFYFEAVRPANAEEKAELYYKAGILSDEVSSYVLCSGLLAYAEGKIHGGWQGFYDSRESLQVSIMNLSRLDQVVSSQGSIYVFENPGVFATVMDQMSSWKPSFRYSLACTYGQVKLAALVLMDLLVKEGVKIYYSGDFDPEGLRIADRLKDRYGESLKLWRFTVEDYQTALSDEPIEGMRLKKLDGLKNANLVLLAEKMRAVGCAGYQELLVAQLVRDIEMNGEFIEFL